MAANLPHGPKAQSLKCSRINPSTNKPCNAIFLRRSDLAIHEHDIYHDQQVRYLCPHCRREKSFRRRDHLKEHVRMAHPETFTYHWSCAAIANPDDVLWHVQPGLSICAYCGMKFQGLALDEELLEHLVVSHRFRKCDTSKKYLQQYHFQRHLKESHAANSSREWTEKLSNRCFVNRKLDQGGKNAAAGGLQASSALMSSIANSDDSPSQRSDVSKGDHQDPARLRYICECCPENPRTFEAEENLRYAVDYISM
jgi:hypothetical protein